MISAWASRITEALYVSDTIEECDKEIYQYGFFLLLSRIYFFLFTVLSGAIFGVTMESIIFYIMFSTLRSYAGGIHAKTEATCTLVTSLAFLCSIIGINVLKRIKIIEIPLGMLILGELFILLWSPLDTKEKTLSIAEQKHYQIIAWTVSFVIMGLTIVSIVLGYYKILYCAAISVILEGSLLLFGKMSHN